MLAMHARTLWGIRHPASSLTTFASMLAPTGNQHKPIAAFTVAASRFIRRPLRTTLNVKNVFDKTYYTGLGNFGTGFYGEPRSLQLSTRWDF